METVRTVASRYGWHLAKCLITRNNSQRRTTLGLHGITVNTVSPGMSDAGVMGQTPQEFQDAVKG